jgi:hypothetical protein
MHMNLHIYECIYEYVLFRCHHFHEHGHLYREFPLLNPPKPHKEDPKKDEEGFTKIITWRWRSGKPSPYGLAKTPITRNNYEILSPLPKNLIINPSYDPSLHGSKSRKSDDSLSTLEDPKWTKNSKVPMDMPPLE